MIRYRVGLTIRVRISRCSLCLWVVYKGPGKCRPLPGQVNLGRTGAEP